MDPQTPILTTEDAAPDAPDAPAIAIPETLTGPWSYLCGPAGTGKTTLARAMVDQIPGTVLAATTGIAAVNLGEGTTINALLGYFDTASLVESYTSGFLHVRLRKLFQAGVRRVLLDELSMCDAEQLTVITRALDEIADRTAPDIETLDTMEAAGVTGSPLAITLIGDFAQLPPVKAPFAFESPEWGRYAAHTHALTHVWRQADPAFLDALWGARRGDPDPVCAYFGPRLAQTIDPTFPGPTLFATNKEVDRYNALRLDKVPARAVTFTSRRWGKERGDWRQIPASFVLKEGALVMILANRRDRETGRMDYANGDLGTVSLIDTEHAAVYVTLARTGQDVAVDWVTRDNTVPLEPGRVAALKAAGEDDKIQRDANGKARMEIVGQVTYLPLRLGWATTVHKSQGLSLDAVQVNTRAGFFKTAGLLYVALSRCRTADGLRLIGSVDGLRARVKVDSRVAPWL